MSSPVPDVLGDAELISLAFEKGREFCDENASRWWRNDWNMSEDFCATQQKHWRANSDRMAELTRQMAPHR